MTDRVSTVVRSANMAAVKGADTKPERYVRSSLFRKGFRFRLHRRDLPGSPDIALPRFRVAVFVHGCFWHGHDCQKGRRPKSNTEFWNDKLDKNIERDRRNQNELWAAGWTPVVIWTCELEGGTNELLALLETRRDTPDQRSSDSELRK